MMGTQETVYNWLMENSGEHTVVMVAEGTGLDKRQAGNALTNLKRKNAVASADTVGNMQTWFAIPGAEFTESNTGSNTNVDRTPNVQKIIYDWITSNPGTYLVTEVADGSGLTGAQVSSAMYNLKKKGAVTKEGEAQNTRWTGVPGVDLGARVSNTPTGMRKTTSHGALAKQKFERALEAFIDAAVEIKDYIVVEDLRQELDELRAFKAQVNEALRRR
jgi:hypothetical protein